MTAAAGTAHSTRAGRPWLAIVGALLLAAALATFAAGLIAARDEGSATTPTLSGPAAAPFQIEHPRSWKPLDATQMAELPGKPAAVLRRTDGRGTVVLTRRGPAAGPVDRLAPGLKRTLDRRFPDFREIGAKVVTLGESRALVYTFARTRTGTAQSVVIVPNGDHSYTLNAVVPPRSPDAAREVGAIIASFRPHGAR